MELRQVRRFSVHPEFGRRCALFWHSIIVTSRRSWQQRDSRHFQVLGSLQLARPFLTIQCLHILLETTGLEYTHLRNIQSLFFCTAMCSVLKGDALRAITQLNQLASQSRTLSSAASPCAKSCPSSSRTAGFLLINYSGPSVSCHNPRTCASHAQNAKDLNQKGVNEQVSKFDDAIAQEKEKQVRTPWHRQGANEPPVKRQRSAGAMTKGLTSRCKWTIVLIRVRKTAHYTLSITQAYPTSHHGGQKYGPQRYRASSPTGTSSTTPFVPRALDTIGTAFHQRRERWGKDSVSLVPGSRVAGR